jgi:hypothetical protein
MADHEVSLLPNTSDSPSKPVNFTLVFDTAGAAIALPVVIAAAHAAKKN